MRPLRLIWLLLGGLGWSLGCGQLLGDVDIGDPVTAQDVVGGAPEGINQSLPLQPSGAVGPSGCAEGCLPRLCEAGQSRCLGGLLELCDADSGNWSVADACATPDLCEIGRTTRGNECEPPRCAAEERICDGQRLRACNTGHTDWVDAQTCTDTERCDPRLGCTALPCTFGEHRCNGPRIEVCDARAEDFIPTGDAPCATAQLCSQGAGAVRCVEPLCDAGQFRCEGTLLQRCSEGRDGWLDFQRCATPELCDLERGALGCIEPSCEAGAKSCVGDTLMQCRATRDGSDPVAACAQAGGCNPITLVCRDPCIVGAARCSGATLEVCNDVLIGWQATACTSAELCNEGAHRCDPPACAAADRSCRGAQPQRCAPGRDGFVDVGAACGSAALCNRQQGTCTPPACAAGETACDGRDTLLTCNADRTAFDATPCDDRGERCRPGPPAECR